MLSRGFFYFLTAGLFRHINLVAHLEEVAMTRHITVITTNNPPNDGQLKAEHAVVVHSLYEAAEVIAHQWLSESLKEIGAQAIFEPLATCRARIDEAYYQLLTKKPAFASDLTEDAYRPPAIQLNFPF
jgi:hypothetical protein